MDQRTSLAKARFFIGVNMDDTMFWMFVFSLGLLYLAMWADKLSGGLSMREKEMLFRLQIWCLKQGGTGVF
ncbi:hypothetical protein [Pasteurella bettyae]|uniref:hypothetical protein n=1 Tax=Pasteurella bettyae TaxID=752 RepID=UPI003D273CD8